KDPQAAIEALLALIHDSADDPFHHQRQQPGLPPIDEDFQEKIKKQVFQALERLDWKKLTESQQTSLLRVYEVALNRLGMPDSKTKQRLIALFDGVYPSKVREQNTELCALLV